MAVQAGLACSASKMSLWGLRVLRSAGYTDIPSEADESSLWTTTGSGEGRSHVHEGFMSHLHTFVLTIPISEEQKLAYFRFHWFS